MVLLTNQNQKKPTRRQLDPAGTATLINKAVSAINAAFRKLNGEINRAFIEFNLFEIGDEAPALFSVNIKTDSEIVLDFQTWLTTLMQTGVLQVDENGRVTFIDPEVAEAFQKGRSRAQSEILSATGQDQFPFPILGTGAQTQQLQLIFQQITNSFAAMSATAINTMTTTLSNGLIAGLSPREMAEVLKNDLKLPLARARTIARTEIQRAHHLGNVSELEAANIEEVLVVAEWATAKDGRVCRDCARLEGRIFTVDEIKGMIPVHPNCRCVAIPVIPGLTEVPDRPTQKQLEDIVAEDQKTDAGKLKPDRGFFEERSGGKKPPGFDVDDAARRQELENEQRLNFEIKAAKIRSNIKQLRENDEQIASAFNDLLEFNDKKLCAMEVFIYDRIREMVLNELAPNCKPGEPGKDGKRGLSIQGNKGDKGDQGDKGDSVKGDKGDQGLRGLSVKGRKGDKGEKGDKGDKVKGDKGDIPDHQMITNKNDKIIGIRFQKPNGGWGDIAKFTSGLKVNNVSNLEFDRVNNPRRMRFLVRGKWTDWIKINRGGGGGLGDAPKDGKIYGRRNGEWVEVTGTANWEYEEFELDQTDVDNGYIDLTFTPITNSLFVFINGVLQSPVSDYTLSGVRITFISRRFSKNNLVETKYQV